MSFIVIKNQTPLRSQHALSRHEDSDTNSSFVFKNNE